MLKSDFFIYQLIKRPSYTTSDDGIIFVQLKPPIILTTSWGSMSMDICAYDDYEKFTSRGLYLRR